MFIVAITGGISTGKSTVANVFRKYDIPVIDADLIARQVVEPGKPAWKKLKRAFGDEIFQENGELNREVLGKIIFDSAEKRAVLNGITHPDIHRTMYKEVIKYFVSGHNFIVMELPLLFETGIMLDYIHKIITVTCEEDIQLTRLIDRQGQLSEADAKKRIASQMPLDIKCDKSHFVIDNSGAIRNTEEEALKILVMLQDSNHHWKLRGILMATTTVILSGIAWVLNQKYKFLQQPTQ